MKPALRLALALVILATAWMALRSRHVLADSQTWLPATSPGPLSRAHAALEHNCKACHTGGEVVPAENCLTCHAGSEALVQRRNTAFHAGLTSCVECHKEHRGAVRPTQMDHAALSRIALRAEPMAAQEGWLRRELAGREAVQEASKGETPRLEGMLTCMACHAHQDRHRQQFGPECLSCHDTTRWTIDAYKHPSPRSQDCRQCHLAPPSHYMGHFEMMSKKLARQEHAPVTDCFRCHQTTAWNDIRGAGWIKHH